MVFYRISLIFSLLTFIFSSCSFQQKKIALFNSKPCSVALDFTENPYVFDSLADLLYEEFYLHFSRLGYQIKESDAMYRLRVSICSLTPAYKYVSPEALLFHSDVSLLLECDLFDPKGEVVDRKKIKMITLVSRAYNPILKESFERFAYRRGLKKIVPEIERYFRKNWTLLVPNDEICPI